MSAFQTVLDAVGEVPDATFLVAVSGGADSAVAAAVVCEVVDRSRVRLVHLDHGTAASALLGDAAHKLALHLGVALTTRRLAIEDGSWEDSARRARRDALLEAARPSDVVVTGHHRDDVAETLLGHLVRGSGARGLSSLRPRAGRFWRPLHSVDRSAVRMAADELELPYVDDPANQDPAFRRNVIRHEILPALERLNPRARHAIARAARHAGQDDDALEAVAAETPIRVEDGAWLAPLAVLRTAEPAVARRILARLLRLARPPYGASTREIESLESVIDGSARSTQLSGGLTATREGAMLAVYRPAGPTVPPDPVELPVPGSVVFGNWRLDASPGPGSGRRTGHHAVLDGAAVGTQLEVRAAAEGDRAQIAGGTKPVRRSLAEAGIPSRLRSGWPVVTAHGKIAWVVGARVADWARPASTGHVVLVVGERTGG